MARFRQFVKPHEFNCSLREQEAAPPAGSSPPPSNPSGTQNYFGFMQQELGIDDESMPGAMEGGIKTLYQIPAYNWGFRIRPPVPAMVKDSGHGSYEVTFLLKQKKLSDPKGFFLPYKEGEKPVYYEGPIEDKIETMSAKELADSIEPMALQGMAGMGGGMGGPPMGGPPMGGMPPPGGAV